MFSVSGIIYCDSASTNPNLLPYRLQDADNREMGIPTARFKKMGGKFIPDPGSDFSSRIQGLKDIGSGSASKNLNILNPKNCF
jgi:hypothetical protein